MKRLFCQQKLNLNLILYLMFPSQDEHGGSENCRPQSVFVSLGRLGDIGSGDEFSAGFVLFLPLVPILAGIKFYAQRGGQHRRRQVFGVIPRLLFRVAEGMMLAQISVLLAVFGNSQTDGCGDKPVRLVGGVSAHYAKTD